jgi:predicted deacetylase
MKRILVLIYFFSLSLFAQDSILFVIRVDDIQSRNTTTLPRSIKQFEYAVESRGAKVTWVVIPHRLIESQSMDGIICKELRESIAKGHEISLHGYNHICPICGSTGHEMYCVSRNQKIPYSQQKDSLVKGLKILKDSLNAIPISFVPPGHAQDSTMFQVLLDKNIDFLSSNGGTKIFIYQNLYNLQQNNEYTWQLTSSQYQSKLQSALQEIRTVGKTNGYYNLLLHDPFIRQGYDNGIVVRWIGDLLDSLNLEYGNKIKYKTLSEAAKLFKLQNINSISQKESSPSFYELNQNYPNPFNPTTKIRYSVTTMQNVDLKIFDVLGNEITTLVNEIKQPGIYEVEFSDLSKNNLPLTSGIYFYQLKVRGVEPGNKSYSQTKKMVFHK